MLDAYMLFGEEKYWDAFFNVLTFVFDKMVVMDAGIASEENLLMLRNKGYDYLCVARGKFKDYVAVKNDTQPVTITDKRRSPIELTMIEQQGIDDTLLFVRSEKKAKKEVSMHEKFTPVPRMKTSGTPTLSGGLNSKRPDAPGLL